MRLMNISLYDQLKELTNIPGAYDKWQQYRRELTDIIIEECPSGSVLIVGAGQCNDIDIAKMSRHFDKVTLFDREPSDNSLASGLDNVTYIYGDILGISDDSYRKLCEEVQDYIAFNMNRFNMEAFADRYISLIEDMYTNACPDIPFTSNSYDNVVCVGVHSQVNNMLAWMWEAYESALGHHDKRVHQYISGQNNRIIQSFNDRLFDIAGKHIIIGAEQGRTGTNGAVEGAHQCILDIQRRINEYSYIDVNLALIDWPFDVDRDIIYQMLIASVPV